MKVYNYDPLSGQYLNASDAQPDPAELAIARARDPEAQPDAWLIPAHATTIAPPAAGANERAVFANGAWSLLAVPSPPSTEPPATTAAELWAAHQAEAMADLYASDRTIVRCVEKGLAVPADWTAYRDALRAIIRAESGDPTATLPTRPAYPAGT